VVFEDLVNLLGFDKVCFGVSTCTMLAPLEAGDESKSRWFLFSFSVMRLGSS